MPEQAYTPAEIAARLRVDVHAVLAWIARNELRALDVSHGAGRRKRWRIPEEALEAFMRARSAMPPPAAPQRRRRRMPAVVSFI